MVDDKRKSLSQPIESGSRLAVFRVIELIILVLLGIGIWGYVYRPWSAAQEENEALKAESASYRLGMKEVSKLVGEESEDTDLIKKNVENLVSASTQKDGESRILQQQQSALESETRDLRNALGEYRRTFGFLDIANSSPSLTQCRYFFAIENRCYTAIGFQIRVPGGIWVSNSLDQNAKTRFSWAASCGHREAYFRIDDKQYPYSEVSRIPLGSGVPASQPADEIAASTRVAIDCLANHAHLIKP